MTRTHLSESGIRMLAVDLGQGALRARVREGDQVMSEFTGPGHRPGQPIERLLLDLAAQAAEHSGSSRFDIIAGGLTGVYGRVPDISLLVTTLRQRYGTTRLLLADDALTSYLGARGDREGAIAAIGTGLVALGYGPGGRTARVDGTGAMIGDEGSGWWIGRQGLIAAMSAFDGRLPGSSALLAAAAEMFGPVDQLPGLVAHSESPIALVASFAPSVAQAAREGDPGAHEIWARAGNHVATALSAAATRAGIATEFEYTLLGGIAAAADLLEPELTRRLRQDFPHSTRTTPSGTSLDGAERLAGLNSIDGVFPLAREARAE